MHKFAVTNKHYYKMSNFKTLLQEREFPILKDSCRVLLKWAPGCGKSKMTIDLVNHALGTLSGKSIKVLFVVAEKAHIKNWQAEFDKWGLAIGKNTLEIICYASLAKKAGMTYDIVVFDEAHHLFSDKRMAAATSMEFEYLYLLSATLTSGKMDMAEEAFGKITTSTVSLNEAINNDILPDPKIYIIGMELDNRTPNQTICIGNSPNAPRVPWEQRNKYIYKKLPCIIMCTEQQKYLYLTNAMEYWKQRFMQSSKMFYHNKWMNLGTQRKTYLGELKTSSALQLINKIPKNKRLVCFCSSVAQAEQLSEKNTISSNKAFKKNQAVIDSFNSKRINQLYAVMMITEGMNLKDIETGIIIQLDGKEGPFIQKAGRVLRADSPIIYIFYYKNTQDETYLKTALENIDSKFIRHINFNQLNTIKL